MEDKLQQKINHYSGYVTVAISNYGEGLYSDAAINARKAAEAACKIVIYHAYPVKRAEDKMAEKTLKELIQILIKDHLTERKVINTIESLQITGNKAAHDNVINKEEGSYAINALQLLTDYLFREHLKIKPPTSINFNSKPAKQDHVKKEVPRERIVIQEKIISQKIDEESEAALLEKLRGLNELERTKYEHLFKAQQQSLKNEISELKRANKADVIEIPVVEQKRRSPKVWMAVLLLFAGFAMFFWLVFKTSPLHVPRAYLEGSHPMDTIFVAIDKMRVLQDNPQLEFRIEKMLAQTIQQKAQSNGIAVNIRVVDFGEASSGTDSVFVKLAGGLMYHVIYWGNLYESALDSNVLEIKGCLTSERTYFRNKRISFKSLGDSLIIKEMNDQANTPIYMYSLFEEKAGRYNQAAKKLSALKSYSEENEISIKNKLASYFVSYGDIQRALRLYDTLIMLKPQQSNFYFLKGRVWYKMAELDSAEVYFKKAYMKDSSNLGNCAELGFLHSIKGNPAEALYYYQKALFNDPNHSGVKSQLKKVQNLERGNFLLSSEYLNAMDSAIVYFRNKDYQQAIGNYSLASKFSPKNADPLAEIANCYFRMGDTIQVLKVMNMAISMDSIRKSTVIYLAGFSDWMKELSTRSDYYFMRAMRLFPCDTGLLNLASKHYDRVKQLTRIVEVGREARRCGYVRRSISKNTALAAFKIGDLQTARVENEYLNLMFPSDTSKARLAQTYFEISKGDPSKQEFVNGLKLIQEAYRLNGKNLLVAMVHSLYMNRVRAQGYSGSNIGRSFANSSLTDEEKLMRMIQEREKTMRNTDVVLYQDKEIKISMIRPNEAVQISRQYPDSTSLRVVHNYSGIQESGMNYHKGQPPAKNSTFPVGKQIVDLVMSNNKLNGMLKLQFLSIELGFYQNNPKYGRAKDAVMIDYIMKRIKNGK